jgi:hypothetical protein
LVPNGHIHAHFASRPARQDNVGRQRRPPEVPPELTIEQRRADIACSHPVAILMIEYPSPAVDVPVAAA